MLRRAIFLLLLITSISFLASAQTQTQPVDPVSWTLDVMQSTYVIPNVVYSVASNYECKLDVYARRVQTGPVPTVVVIHGGGWVGGTKEGEVPNFLPYLQMGFAVVNVEYRMARVALAPAAVEDCRVALRWVFRNAQKYGFDPDRIVVTGGSAGGHLALMTGMLDTTAGFDYPKEWDQNNPPMKVAAIINWFGITDVKEILSGPDKQNYAASWIGSSPDPEKLADRVSPLTYVRKGLPPILTIHGDNDQLVPYTHAVRLNNALEKAGVQHKFITIPGGHHGGFTPDQMKMIYGEIREFLKQTGVIK
jgi:acetyl esterase/lipase